MWLLKKCQTHTGIIIFLVYRAALDYANPVSLFVNKDVYILTCTHEEWESPDIREQVPV